MRLADQTDPILRGFAESGCRAAVIPVGSLEQHGPHLPVSTDSDIVTEVARRLCEAGGFLQLPTIPYGVSYEHAPLFQLSTSGRTVLGELSDLIASLNQNGIGTTFVINGHHGNQRALSRLAGKVRRRLGDRVRVFALPYWRFMEGQFDHAGPVETSLMLAISGRVDMSKAVRGLDTAELSRDDLRRISRLASRSFPAATGNGIWGDPTGATADRGSRILAEVVANLYRHCQMCLTNGEQQLHK